MAKLLGRQTTSAERSRKFYQQDFQRAPLCKAPVIPEMTRRRTDVLMAPARFRTGDMVKVTSGKFKGEWGKAYKLERKKGLVYIEGLNLKTKHNKPKKEGETGSITKIEHGIHESNVQAIDWRIERYPVEGYTPGQGKDEEKNEDEADAEE